MEIWKKMWVDVFFLNTVYNCSIFTYLTVTSLIYWKYKMETVIIVLQQSTFLRYAAKCYHLFYFCHFWCVIMPNDKLRFCIFLRNFVRLIGNWMKFCNVAKIWTCIWSLKFCLKILNHWEKFRKSQWVMKWFYLYCCLSYASGNAVWTFSCLATLTYSVHIYISKVH